jgi:acetyl-CoA carboxylase biotin carboxyl carrier protein
VGEANGAVLIVEDIVILNLSVCKIEVAVGDEITEGDVLVIMECMKMEIPVEADVDGKVVEIVCAEGEPVDEGRVLVVTEP